MYFCLRIWSLHIKAKKNKEDGIFAHKIYDKDNNRKLKFDSRNNYKGNNTQKFDIKDNDRANYVQKRRWNRRFNKLIYIINKYNILYNYYIIYFNKNYIIRISL